MAKHRLAAVASKYKNHRRAGVARPHLSRSHLLVYALCIGVILMTTGAKQTSGDKLFIGTLMSDPAHTAIEAANGLNVAMLELSWRDYQPARDVWNQSYIRQQQERLQALLASNRRVTLALGVHYPPAWLYDTPNSRYVDEDGETSGELNVVFNEQVRTEVAGYFTRLAADFGLRNFWSVRLTSGGSAEVLFPDGGSYWAFDTNALGGASLPLSLSPNPLPEWRPGETDVPTSAVAEWTDWYLSGLVDVVTWQMQTLSALGFTGYFEILTPGTGVRPSEYQAAIAAHLPSGLIGVGAVWHRFYAALPVRRDVVAYVSSVADRSGDDDLCTPADRAVALDDPRIRQWSATRWISRVADERGLDKRGENPGFDAPPDLNDHYRDASPDGMMATALRQAQACGFQGLYWAHDEQLWDGIADFEQLASWIRTTNGGPGSLPDPPS